MSEAEEQILFADGFDKALLGVGSRFGQPDIAVYDTDKCIEILQAQGMTYEEAWDTFDFNIVGAWLGEKTPIYMKKAEGKMDRSRRKLVLTTRSN
tara:strand:- start:45 stop:329 length:285 start_codon:yes stop_codon:yes gene_type:complete